MARLIRHAAIAVKTELVLRHHTIAAETELPDQADASLEPARPRLLRLLHRSQTHLQTAASVRPEFGRLPYRTSPDTQNRTAIYDISAQVVYLPNGRRLEAHSGFGSYMDDPRYVHIRRKGATPPNTYRLVSAKASSTGYAPFG